MNNNVVVKIEKSGNRFNAWDADGNKHTSEIGTSTRKKAYNAGMALERRTGKNWQCRNTLVTPSLLIQ